MTRSCSHCGNNGHNSRTCADTGDGGIMLFGVRLTEAPIRKSFSLNNLSQYEQPQDPNADIAAGYASDDVVHLSSGNRERKRGVPWTEEEHKLFLLGLQKVGKGDWRGISRKFVKTRTPTQVASHAQKYFLRRNNMNRRRRRSSLFDITTDTFMGLPIEEEHVTQEIASPPPQPPQMNCNLGGYPVPAYPMTMSPAVRPISLKNNLTLGRGDQTNISSTNLVRPIPVFPLSPASRIPDLDLNQKSIMDPSPMSLKLSTSSSSDQQSSPRHSAFQVMPRFSGSDSIIIVA